MDWIIGTSILAAIAGLVKIVKDIKKERAKGNEQRLFARLVLPFEVAILILILYFGIYGRLVQKEKDQQKVDLVTSKLDRGLIHTDSTISESTKQSRDSTLARIQKMEDTIKQYEKAKDLNRKPYIDILPYGTQFNPQIEIVADTVKTRWVYINYGTSSALELHYKYCCIRRDVDTFKILPLEIFTRMNKATILLPSREFGLKDETVLVKRFYNPDNEFFQCAFYCFKDSLGREYGPVVKMFKWKCGNLTGSPQLPSQEEFDAVEYIAKRQGYWPSKFF